MRPPGGKVVCSASAATSCRISPMLISLAARASTSTSSMRPKSASSITARE